MVKEWRGHEDRATVFNVFQYDSDKEEWHCLFSMLLGSRSCSNKLQMHKGILIFAFRKIRIRVRIAKH